jgi:hypothetical protein
MLGMAILAMLIFYGISAHAQSQIGVVSSTNITVAINTTAAFINRVNQSGYLVFYPNLAEAYNYLNLARQNSQTNTQYAYLLLTNANGSAQAELNRINQYKSDSLYVLIVSAILLAIMLYILMMPKALVNKRKGAK